jgi:hypothetical protein
MWEAGVEECCWVTKIWKKLFALEVRGLHDEVQLL